MIACALVLAAIAAEPSVPVPLGVAAPSAGVLYVVDAEQAVTAVELKSGKHCGRHPDRGFRCWSRPLAWPP
jgi:hypothetical protein